MEMKTGDITNIDTALMQIQAELKVAKSLHNDFSDFDYRSAELILNASKPICLKYGVVVFLSDTVVQIGERYYIKATATAVHTPTGEDRIVDAYAREPLAKKGMDESQITGSASSYARKYALNGLFCLDDNKDPDSGDNRDNSQPDSKPKKSAGKELAGGASTPEQVAKMKEVSLSKNDKGERIFTDAEVSAYKKMRETKTAAEVIETMEQERAKRCPDKYGKELKFKDDDIPF